MSELAVVSNESSTSVRAIFQSQEKINVIKNLVAKNATNDEFLMFKDLAIASNLNPFKKEIWFIKTNNGPQIMTGINGYWKIANSHPMFQGYEEDLIMENGKLMGAWCKVYRKDRQYPIVAKVYLEEYIQPASHIWKTKPKMMILKVAESVALRKAFPEEFNGIYTEEEMPQKFAINNVENVVNMEIRDNKTVNPHLKKFDSEKMSDEARYDDIKKIKQQELSEAIKNNLAWGYRPPIEELEGKELFDAIGKIKSYLADNQVVYISNKENKSVWVENEIEELKEFCCFNPVVYSDEQKQVMDEDVPF